VPRSSRKTGSSSSIANHGSDAVGRQNKRYKPVYGLPLVIHNRLPWPA
jgi:hypothetical protein